VETVKGTKSLKSPKTADSMADGRGGSWICGKDIKGVDGNRTAMLGHDGNQTWRHSSLLSLVPGLKKEIFCQG
jgi:hypothetical protein